MNAKYIIIVFALLRFCTFDASAQSLDNRIPFVVEGKQWECNLWKDSLVCWEGQSFWPPVNIEYSTYYYTMSGDTLIGGKTMKKLYRSGKCICGDDLRHYFGAVCEEDACVYIVYEGCEDPILLYDFTPDPSKEVSLTYTDLWTHPLKGPSFHFDVRVERITDLWWQSWEIDGYEVYKFQNSAFYRIHNCPVRYSPYPEVVQETNDESSFVAMEGIGNVDHDPFDPSLWPITFSLICDTYFTTFSLYDERRYDEIPAYVTLTSIGGVENVYIGDRCIATRYPDFIIYDDFPDFISITSPGQTSRTSGIYDLQGRRLTTEPERGVYIKDGRKYVRTRDY